MEATRTYTAFEDDAMVASGELGTVMSAIRARTTQRPDEQILIFDDATGKQVDFDLDTTDPSAPKGPGRPRLGVIAREVTLLPRHWDWLAEQPSGASAALRRLVDAARKNESPADKARRAAAATGRVMTVLAGNRPNFEEAYRSLDAGDRDTFTELISDWPADVQAHLLRMAQDAFPAI